MPADSVSCTTGCAENTRSAAASEASMPARSFVVGDGVRIVGEQRAKPTTRARLPKKNACGQHRGLLGHKKRGCKEGGLVAFPPPLKALQMVHFFGASRRSSDHVVLARLHAPGRLGTSQLSNPNTQWVAPSVGIAQPRSHRSIDIVEMFHESPFSGGWTTRG